MFINRLCGANTGHRPGFVHKVDSAPHHLIMHFKTPFFYVFEGKRVKGAPGDCLFFRKGDLIVHGPLSDKEQFVNDWIYFEADEDLHDLPSGILLSPENGGVIGELINSILSEENTKDEYSARLISDTIYKMIVLLKRAELSVSADQTPEMLRFKAARAYIITHCAEHWTLERMADMAGYSVSRFCALYTEQFGKSPMDELLEKRFRLAKKLLSFSSYRIGEISLMCGFSSIHYFSRFFKARTGESPSEYANRRK